ncbi:hypothetical protein V2J09_010795 [Rumex salicifolius]
MKKGHSALNCWSRFDHSFQPLASPSMQANNTTTSVASHYYFLDLSNPRLIAIIVSLVLFFKTNHPLNVCVSHPTRLQIPTHLRLVVLPSDPTTPTNWLFSPLHPCSSAMDRSAWVTFARITLVL